MKHETLRVVDASAELTPASGEASSPNTGSSALETTTGAERTDCVSTPSFTIVRITKRRGSLSKRISRASDGLAVDSSACALSTGEARTVSVTDGMRGLSRLYGSLRPNEAVVLSNADLGPDPREVCAKEAYGEVRKRNPRAICRSNRFLAAAAKAGLQLFEVDDHGLPEGGSPPNAAEMVAILGKLLPELDIPGAAKLLTHSTSSYIFDSATGEMLKGEGGKHLTLLLSDQSRAKDLKELLEVRQWANGYGHVHISRDGKQLERTMFDLSVFAPERLVFEAGADLSPGLRQERPAPIVQEGLALDMSLLPRPTLAERSAAEKAKRVAKESTRAAAEEKRAAYIRGEATKLVALRGVSQAEAERIVTARTDCGSLDDEDVLVFTDERGESRTVGYVLDHVAEFIGRPMCDPLEPEAGRSKAMILRGPGGQPFIHSFKHGGRRFTFERLVSQDGAADQAVFDFSDLANAHRIARAFGNNLIATAAGWYVFNGRYWERGDHLAERQALNLSRLVLQDAKYRALSERLERNDFRDEHDATAARKLSKKWIEFAASCENKSTITAAMNIARTLLWRDLDDMNVDPWLLNVRNGTIDLRTGVLRPHDRDDLITMQAPTAYFPDAACPEFEKAVSEILGDDRELASFLQRFLGYGLTGVTTEQKMLIPWGDGSNGKGTILTTVQKVLGRDYCGSAPPKLLESSRSDRHPTEIADLYGKRMVIASETEEGAQLREAFLKLATGGDPLKGRFMRKDFFEFDATHKFVLQTNHRPEVKGTDYAIWRRLVLLPFEVTFGDAHAVAAGEATRIRNNGLSEKLSGELDGVLAWMVRGCLAWQADGLAEPAKVRGATEAYREEQDRMGQFIAERCVYGTQQSVEQAQLYREYKNWMQDNGYYPMGSGKFRKQLLKLARGKVTASRSTTGPRKNVAVYQGIASSGGCMRLVA